MAYAQHRSANRALEQGMVDGSYKQYIKDRGGFPEHTTCENLRDLSDTYYGRIQAPMMETPDGLSCAPLYGGC